LHRARMARRRVPGLPDARRGRRQAEVGRQASGVVSTRRLSAAVGGVAVILVLSACGTGGSVVGKSADKTNGGKIFQTTCAGCHILAAAGSQGTFGPNLDAAYAEARSEGYKQSVIRAIVHDQTK